MQRKADTADDETKSSNKYQTLFTFLSSIFFTFYKISIINETFPKTNTRRKTYGGRGRVGSSLQSLMKIESIITYTNC